jgi:hypothetical protein
MFLKNMSPPFLEMKSKPSNKSQDEGSSKQISACCIFHASLLLGLPFNPENGGDVSL